MELVDFNKSLKAIYWEVIRGSSILTYENTSYYIKHLGAKDAGILESKENEYFNKARNLGMQTNAEKIESLVSEGLYDPKDDKRIVELKSTLVAIKKTKTKLVLAKDIENIKSDIEKTSKEIKTLEENKNNLLESTCEIYSIKKMNEFYIYYSVYKNEDCTEASFDAEEFDNLEQSDLNALINNYSKFSEKFYSHNLKRIAVNNFFLNYFYMCEDNAQIFYGKPVSLLSFFQIELFGYARYFRNLMSESTVACPEEYMSDPDQIIDFYSSSGNMEKALQERKQEGGKEATVQASSIMGATTKDLKRMQEMKNAGAVNLADLAAANGGTLDFQQLLKAHGAI